MSPHYLARFQKVDEKFIENEKIMEAGFKKQDDRMNDFEKMFNENVIDTSSIFYDIFRMIEKR